MKGKYSLCLVTVPGLKTAESLAAALVKKRLAACVSTVPSVRSFYTWRGKTEKSREAFLVVKTRKKLSAGVMKFIRKNHPYSVPEILFFDVSGGDRDYLKWMDESCL